MEMKTHENLDVIEVENDEKEYVDETNEYENSNYFDIDLINEKNFEINKEYKDYEDGVNGECDRDFYENFDFYKLNDDDVMNRDITDEQSSLEKKDFGTIGSLKQSDYTESSDLTLENFDINQDDLEQENDTYVADKNSDIFKKDFLDQYNYQEEIKVKSLYGDTRVVEHNLYEDIKKNEEYEFDSQNYTDEEIEYLKTENLDKLFQENYGISINQLKEDYDNYLNVVNDQNINEIDDEENLREVNNIENDGLKDFLESYNFEEEVKVKSLYGNTKIVEHNLYNDIKEINDYYDSNIVTGEYSLSEYNYLRNEEITQLLQEDYEISINQFKDDYENFKRNQTVNEFNNVNEDSEKMDLNQIDIVSIQADINIEEINFNELEEKEEFPIKLEKLYNVVNERLALGDEECNKLYQQNLDNIVVGDSNSDTIAYYDPSDKKIYINEDEDLINPLGAGTTYLHEVGHVVDDASESGYGCLSDDPQFSNMIQEDFNDYVYMTMMENNCDQQTAYGIISYELMEDKSGNVSDIYGGASKNKCEGYWGHSAEYWNIEGNLAKETFANFFEASCCDDKYKVNMLKKFLPKSYNRFKQLVRREIK